MRLIAHRGFAAAYPENTLTAVTQAAGRADAVEVDVRRCGSGEPVVIHDATVDRVTEGIGRVADYSCAELQDLDVCGSGEGVPSLAAVLEAVPDRVPVHAELKEPGLGPDVAALVKRCGNAVIISSFDAMVLSEYPVTGNESLAYLTRTAAGLSVADALGCSFLHAHHGVCTRSFVRQTHETGLAVNAWTIDSRETAARLADAGVDGVIADHAAVLDG